MNLDLNFLSSDQYNFNEFDVFQKRGNFAPVSDFAIAMGADTSTSYYYNNSINLKDRTGKYWGSTVLDYRTADVINDDGEIVEFAIDNRTIGARPCVSYSSICNQVLKKSRASDGILEVEFGYYPQTIVHPVLVSTLETNLWFNNLSLTGKVYTTDANEIIDYDKEFIPKKIFEFEYQGKKYVRVKVKPHYNNNKFLFSNGEEHKMYDYIWLLVEPIKWLVDEKRNLAISEKILFSGVPFYHSLGFELGFEYSDIKEFMDKYLSKEIIVNSNQISHELISETEEAFTNVTNIQPEIVNQNMSIDDVINETLSKMDEILGEENQKVFTKVKK